jgi:hypothetical protein
MAFNNTCENNGEPQQRWAIKDATILPRALVVAKRNSESSVFVLDKSEISNAESGGVEKSCSDGGDELAVGNITVEISAPNNLSNGTQSGAGCQGSPMGTRFPFASHPHSSVTLVEDVAV